MPQPITPSLVDLAPDIVTVEASTGVDEYGNITGYDPPVDYKCRVLGRSKMVLDPDGQERLSGATVIFVAKVVTGGLEFGEFNFSLLDRFTLPLRFSGEPRNASNLEARQPKPLNIDRETDENGAHHTTVYFSVARLRGY